MSLLNIFKIKSILIIGLLISCGGGGTGESVSDSSEESQEVIEPVSVTLYEQLIRPWGLSFLPDNRILITEKAGTIVVLSADGKNLEFELNNLPLVDDTGQGGLLDIAIDPDFNSDPWIYWTYSEPGVGSEQGLIGTAVARGRFIANALQDIEVIYRQTPKVIGSGHFGSRLAFRSDKTLFVTLGDRQKNTPAQDLTQTLGKVIRINRDGSIPADNPFIGGSLPEIWSYGHRNPQGAAMRPDVDQLWISEHGPQGGDELNQVFAGGNYGWPIVSYGCNYGDPIGEECRIGGGIHSPEYVEPVSYWVPTSIAPSGMIFYTGSAFPTWQGDVFITALAGTSLWRIQLSGNIEEKREEYFYELGERIRDVEQGPEGWIYLITYSGKLIQVRG